jgi:hypothetical protein
MSDEDDDLNDEMDLDEEPVPAAVKEKEPDLPDLVWTEVEPDWRSIPLLANGGESPEQLRSDAEGPINEYDHYLAQQVRNVVVWTLCFLLFLAHVLLCFRFTRWRSKAPSPKTSVKGFSKVATVSSTS